MTAAKKNEPQCKIKNAIYKMTVAKKRSQTVEKMAPYKIIVAKKNWTKQRRIKNAPYKNDCCQKIGAKQLKKNGTL